MAAVIPLPQTSKWAKCGNQPSNRKPNQESRTREHLTSDEVERIIDAARRAGGRLANRDVLLIMMAYRHDFRASELIALRWDQIDLKAGTLHVTRLKHGSPSTHPLRGPELRALRAWKREQGEATPYVFTSLRGGPMTRRTVHHVVAEAAKAAGIGFPVHPHICAMPRATTWQTPARTRGRSSGIWATRIFSTRSAIPNWPPAGSRISGRINANLPIQPRLTCEVAVAHRGRRRSHAECGVTTVPEGQL
jgi:type 1 fimbriae regulatory protein FimB/type 1 fimbriae regulatory protein FimE